MNAENIRRQTDKESLLWRDLGICLLTILLSIVGYLYVDLNARVTTMDGKKLDKEEFYRITNEVNKKLDRLIDMHLTNNTGRFR